MIMRLIARKIEENKKLLEDEPSGMDNGVIGDGERTTARTLGWRDRLTTSVEGQ